ncbi:MFS transporter [Actinomadura sp. WMMA1423]|uniref:MFS transporter n=1 Tax=Actinomadura sp. WMMA1423 TaxID=2591108 RepID=UPI00197AD6D1|nr:MFS transporter [Actinomadura sp. WMMA1423]
MTSEAAVGAFRLIGTNRSFRALWTARSVSFLGDSLSLVALMLYVADTTGQALAVALLLLVGDFAPALLGPLAGAVSDRFALRRVMVTCELVQGALLAVIALWLPSLPVLLVLVALRAIAGQVFQPASRAVVPALVRDRDLESANAAIGFGTNGGEALGPLLAALLLPLLDVRGVLLVDAATFLVSAVVLGFLPGGRPAAGGEEAREPTTLLGETGRGLRYIAASPLLRAIGLGYFAVVAFNGIDDVALVFLAKDTLHGGDSAVGLLLAAVGIGLFAGYALLARTRAGMPMAVLLTAGFAVSSAGNLLTGLAWAVAAAFAVQLVRGLGIAAMDVATSTLIQRSVPPHLLGRVFGSLYGAIGVAAALSYLGGGVLLDLTDPRVAFITAGSAGLVATLATAAALRRSGRDASPAGSDATAAAPDDPPDPVPDGMRKA